ncbi:hypothetical protein HK098_004995 [Nowakowskiella sp. JEL0407]|nr:hypothetical protein HK098_004995 [Nowakowskiella sp. JEL0407]
MSSGFGTNGGRGRCFPFWQEFAKCYVSVDDPIECKNQYEDYNECLYHKKELKRLKMVEEKYYKMKAEAEAANAPEKKSGLFSSILG